jgi:hypothetical protein
VKRFESTAAVKVGAKGLAYNLTRVMNVMGIQPLVAVMRA